MKPLKYDRAIEAMRKPRARLVKMHLRQAVGGFAFYVVPVGPVEHVVADKIIAHPLVRAGRDCLFPGHDRTWRMISDSAPSTFAPVFKSGGP